jgi:hypothetical protein
LLDVTAGAQFLPNTVTDPAPTRNQRRYRKLALPSAANTWISLSYTYIVISGPYDVRQEIYVRESPKKVDMPVGTGLTNGQ